MHHTILNFKNVRYKIVYPGSFQSYMTIDTERGKYTKILRGLADFFLWGDGVIGEFFIIWIFFYTSQFFKICREVFFALMFLQATSGGHVTGDSPDCNWSGIWKTATGQEPLSKPAIPGLGIHKTGFWAHDKIGKVISFALSTPFPHPTLTPRLSLLASQVSLEYQTLGQ